jgi:hypothetical protein
MEKDKKLFVRLTTYEFDKLQDFANNRGVTMSHIIREYIRRLPKPRATANSSQHSERGESKGDER